MDDYLVVQAGELTFAADRAILAAFPYLNAVFARQSQVDRDKNLLDLTGFISTPLQLHKHFHVLVPERDLQLLCAWVTTRDVTSLLRINDDVKYWVQLSQYLGNVTVLPRDLLREARRRRWGYRTRECTRLARRAWRRAWAVPLDVHRKLTLAGLTGAHILAMVRLIAVCTMGIILMLFVGYTLLMHGAFVYGLIGVVSMNAVIAVYTIAIVGLKFALTIVDKTLGLEISDSTLSTDELATNLTRLFDSAGMIIAEYVKSQ